jgi:hypothetical protein
MKPFLLCLAVISVGATCIPRTAGARGPLYMQRHHRVLKAEQLARRQKAIEAQKNEADSRYDAAAKAAQDDFATGLAAGVRSASCKFTGHC